jgi:hypothetical protein
MKNKIQRSVGVFGPRSAGKTSFWACLYGSKGSPEVSASFPADKTREKLNDYWIALRHNVETHADGKPLDATALGVPHEFSFQLASQATNWEVSTRDYSGTLVELVHQADKPGNSLRTELAAWIRSCDAMLVLVPANLSSDHDGERLQYKDALAAMMNVFRDSPQLAPLPVCLAVTKSDILDGEFKDEYGASETLPSELNWLQEYVNLVQNQLGPENVRIFLISAFGGHAEENKSYPPASGPKPRNLEASLLWLLQESDRCLLNSAVAAEDGSRRWPHRYSRAIGEVERVTKKGLPPSRTEQLQSLHGKLISARHKQRLRRAIAGACAAISLLAAADYLWERKLKDSSEATIATGKATPESVRKVENFIEWRSPFFRDARENARTWYEQKIKDEANEVRRVLDENPLPDSFANRENTNWPQYQQRAKRRLDACERFIGIFPNTSQSAVFKRDVEAATLVIHESEKYSRFYVELAELHKQLKHLPNLQTMQSEFDRFCKRFPEEQYLEASKAYEHAKSVLAAKKGTALYARLVKDAAEIFANCNSVASKPPSDGEPPNYSPQIEAIDNWLNEYSKEDLSNISENEKGGLITWQNDLSLSKQKLAIQWDRLMYNSLRDSSVSMFDGSASLKKAIKKAEDYLKINSIPLAMKTDVLDWLRYARALEEPQGITIRPVYAKVSGHMQNTAFAENIQASMRVRKTTKVAWEQHQTTGVMQINNEGPLNTTNRTFTFPPVGQIRIEMEKYNIPPRGPNSAFIEAELLPYLKEGQKPGQSTVEALLQGDHFWLGIILGGLPVRHDLPAYPNGEK